MLRCTYCWLSLLSDWMSCTCSYLPHNAFTGYTCSYLFLYSCSAGQLNSLAERLQQLPMDYVITEVSDGVWSMSVQCKHPPTRVQYNIVFCMYGTSGYHKICILEPFFLSKSLISFFLSLLFVFSLSPLFLLLTGVVWFHPVPPLSSSSCCLLWVTVHWALQTKARKLPCLGTAVTCIHVHI